MKRIAPLVLLALIMGVPSVAHADKKKSSHHDDDDDHDDDEEDDDDDDDDDDENEKKQAGQPIDNEAMTTSLMTATTTAPGWPQQLDRGTV
ncbi:MAG TPA: hypothetical protein VGF99_05780, partial [Myxococcota bacterium]